MFKNMKTAVEVTNICQPAKILCGNLTKPPRSFDWKQYSDIMSWEHLLQICTVQAVWRFIQSQEIILDAQQHNVPWQMRLS